MGIDPTEDDAESSSIEELIEQEIARAEEGDAAAGRELLLSISHGLTRGNLHPMLAKYHADCLWNHVQLGISLERALHVYKYQIKATAFDPIELAAVFELLVEFGDMKKGDARAWIKSHIGASKKAIENASAAVDIKALEAAALGGSESDQELYRRQRYLDLLLHTAGSMRRIVSEAIPQN